jgi:endonuclease/exonuclease/phosphatase family metal-dependent hydrolase
MILGVFLFFSSLVLASSNEFCVQTFNVYGPAYASSVNHRISLLADEVIASPCDSYQFQELWKEDQFEILDRQLEPRKFALLWADDIRQDGKMIGLGSAFQGSIAWAKSDIFTVNNNDGLGDWIRGTWGVEKGFTLMQVKLDNAPPALFVNTHTHPSNSSIRIAQIVQLIQTMAAQKESLPTILTGDFNATPDSVEWKLIKDVANMRDSFLEKNKSYNDICTYCGDNPLSWSSEDRVIDFVFLRNSKQFDLEVKSSEVNLKGEDKNSPLSDHFGVQSVFSWSPKTQADVESLENLEEKLVSAAAATHQALLTLEDSNEYAPTFQILKRWYKAFLKKKIPADLEVFFSH